MQHELAADRFQLRRLDQLAMRDLDGVQGPLELVLPELEEARELGEFGEEVVGLPDKGLEQPMMIGTPVQDLRGGQAVALELPLEVLRDHSGSPDRFNAPSFELPLPAFQAETLNKLFKNKALAADAATC